MTPDVVYLDRAAEARQQIPRVIRLLLRISDRRARELANALGLSEASLSDRLTGKTRITGDEIAVCAAFFGVDAGVFYRDPDSIRRRILTGATVTNEDTVGYRAWAGQGPSLKGRSSAEGLPDGARAAA